MTNVYFLLLLVSVWDSGLTYKVAREGDNVLLSFNIRSDVQLIGKDDIAIFDFDFRDDNPLTFDSIYRNRVYLEKNQSKSEGHFSFTLLNVSSSDAGLFKCWTVGGGITSSELLVIAREPRLPDVECDTDPPVEGDRVTLTCTSSSRSLPQGHPLVMKYRWRWNGKDAITQQGKASLTWKVSRAVRGDNFTCQAYEEGVEGLSSAWSSPFQLQPLYGPDSIRIGPNPVREGDTLTCSADCNPRCDITWTGRDEQVTTGLGQVDFGMDIGQSGTMCTAWNPYGKISRIVNVTVLFAPEKLTLEDGLKTITEGESITFTGSVHSNPEPKVVIRKPNGLDVPMTTREGTGDSEYKISYTIDSAECVDHGLYNVIAENKYGSANSSVGVIVKCSPRLDSRKHTSLLDRGSDMTTWSFLILGYPEPTLDEVFFINPEKGAQVVHLSSNNIQVQQQTQNRQKVLSNLHEFNVDFPCDPPAGEYLLSFHNTEGKNNVSFTLGRDLCLATGCSELCLYIAIPCAVVSIALLLLVSSEIIHRRRMMSGNTALVPYRRGNRVPSSTGNIPTTTWMLTDNSCDDHYDTIPL